MNGVNYNVEPTCNQCGSQIQLRVTEIVTVPATYSFRGLLCASHRREIEDHFNSLVTQRGLQDVKVFTRDMTEDEFNQLNDY